MDMITVCQKWRFACKTRSTNTLKVSKIGPIKIAKVNAGAEMIAGAAPVAVNLLSSTSFTASMADINPMSNEPASPIKILAGVKLYRKILTLHQQWPMQPLQAHNAPCK